MDEHGVGTYAVRNRAGVRLYGSTYEEVAIQDALDRLGGTIREKVLLKDNFPDIANGLTHTYGCVEVPAHSIVELQGYAKLASGVNLPILANAHPASNDIDCIIRGGTWDYDKTNNTTVDVPTIKWEHSTSSGGVAVDKEIFFQNLTLLNGQWGLMVDCDGDPNVWLRVNKLNVQGCTEHSLHLYKVYDALLRGLWLGSTAGDHVSLYSEIGNHQIFEHCYINQLIRFIRMVGLHFAHVFNDQSGYYGHGIVLAGCRWSHLDDVIVKAGGNDNDQTQSAIRLETSTVNSIHNKFSVIEAGRLHTTENNQWKYGIEEADANQNFNIYSVIGGSDCVTAAVRMLGANSRPTAATEDEYISGGVARV